jgi:hypothetical protein
LSFEEEGLLYIHPTKSLSIPRNDTSHQTDSEKSESDKMSTLKAVKDLWIYNTTPLSPNLSVVELVIKLT